MLTIRVAIAAAALSAVAIAAGAATVAPSNMMGQVGHTAEVCGVVAANNAAGARAHPAFLAPVDLAQPNQAAAHTA